MSRKVKRSRFEAAAGRGIVPVHPQTEVLQQAKPQRSAGGAATSHHLKFSGAGDAANVHADVNHGTILSSAQLRLVFWGKEWATIAPPVSMGTVVNDVETILAGPYLDGLEQYFVSDAHVDRVIDLTDEDPPNPLSADDPGNRVNRLIDDGVVPEPSEENVPAIYVVFLPSRVQNEHLKLPPSIAGLHSKLTNIDWDDFWIDDVYVAWVGNNGNRDSISSTFSHELVETLTDPAGDGWQVEPRSDSDWHEIGDVCNSSYRLNGVVVQSYWSNSDNACIVPDSSFTVFHVQWIWRPNRIEWLGGVDQDGNPWQFPRQIVMDRIRSGDHFKVHGGTSGKDSLVGIYYLDARHPYLATNTDGAPDDNLLALPQHPPG